MKKGVIVAFSLSLIIFIISISIVIASHTVTTSTGTTSYDIKEDIVYLFNISINNTDVGNAANITQVNITLPTGFTFASSSQGTNSLTAANLSFSNTTSVLTWTNTTYYVINGTINNTYFWFNATAATAGNYNFTITTLNTSGVYYFSFNISVHVNDTTLPTVAILIPTNNSNSSNTALDVNFTTYDSVGLSTCWYSNDSMSLNTTLTNCNTNITTIVWADGRHNVTVWVNDTSNNVNSTSIKFSIDLTAPTVSIAIPGNNSNSSNTALDINFTAYDGVGLNTCWYSNDSMSLNTTLTDCGTNITTVVWSEGKHNVTVWANDSLNNVRSTSVKFTIDITAPTISFSCTPTKVYTGDIITCTCAASDSVDLRPSVNYAVNPSTASSGTITTTCTGKDESNNSASSSLTYIVESQGSGVGGGGGGGSSSTTETWKKTYTINNDEFKAGSTKNLAEKERVKVSVDGASHSVGVLDITGTSVLVEVSSTPQKTVLNIGQTLDFEITGDNYYDLSVKLNSIADNKASLLIKSIHEKIPVIQEEFKEEAEKPASSPTEEIGELPEGETKSLNWLWILIGVVVILVFIGIGYEVKKRKS